MFTWPATPYKPAHLTILHLLILLLLLLLLLLQVNEQFTTYTATDVAEGLQNFLICIEMFIAALAHSYAFPPRVRTCGDGTHAVGNLLLVLGSPSTLDLLPLLCPVVPRCSMSVFPHALACLCLT
jgi:hypothetical protein